MLDESNDTVNHVLRLFDYSYAMKTLKQRIEQVQAETGWSNAELARQAGTSRTAPTDWLKGDVSTLSSAVAQKISSKTRFSATWLATGDGSPYKNERDETHSPVSWPFTEIDAEKVQALGERQRLLLEGAIVYAAAKLDIDIRPVKKGKSEAM